MVATRKKDSTSTSLCLWFLSEGADYIAASETLLFPVGSEDGVMDCISISILDDDIIESDEVFSLRLTNVVDNVFVPVSSTRISILDNDSKPFKI